MKHSPSRAGKSAAESIGKRIQEWGDWRGETVEARWP
jgi:hypothetical protein